MIVGPNLASTASQGNVVVETRNPSSSDIKGNAGLFPLGQLWVNKSTDRSWQLTSYHSDGSGITAIWASLNGGSRLSIGSVTVEVNIDPGTNPVVADESGQLNFNSIQTANGSIANGIAVGSIEPHTVTIAIQQAGMNSNPDATKNGISHFDSSSFNVDDNGFVSLLISIPAIQKQINSLQSQIDLLK